LVANVARRGVRTVAFRQHAGGVPVLGGQISFRYKHDRLIAIASEALPHVPAPAAVPEGRRGIGQLLALTRVPQEVAGPVAAGPVDGPFILPLVGDAGVVGYRTVLRVKAEQAAGPGRWDVYVDAGSGAPVARLATVAFAEGSLRFDVPLRQPAGERTASPAP